MLGDLDRDPSAKSNGRTDSAVVASYPLPVPNRGARCAELTSSVLTAAVIASGG